MNTSNKVAFIDAYFGSYADKLRKKLMKKYGLQSHRPVSLTEETPKVNVSSSLSSLPALFNRSVPFVFDTSVRKDDNTYNMTENFIARTSIFNRERVNLESHQLIWLDANVNKNESDLGITIEVFRKIIDYTKLFDNIEECLQYVEQTKNTTTFIVCSEWFGKLIGPQLKDSTNIWSIYIYCPMKNDHQQWILNYSKIKGIYVHIEELLDNLTQDVQKYLKYEQIGLFSEMKKQDNTGSTSQYPWWRPLVDILCHLTYPDHYRQRLVNALKIYYKDKEEELKIVQELESDYKPDKALWWYTRQTFFYRLLNQAFRQQNIELMFLFGFYIQDLHRQLKEEHRKFKLIHLNDPIITVYRGQLMSREEFKTLKKQLGIGTTITVNSVFSTSLNRLLSLSFIPSPAMSEELKRVLFEIEIDVRTISLFYADISHFSAFSNESEILFMSGTIFKVRGSDIFYNETEKIWIIKSKLAYDIFMKDDEEFDCIIERRKIQICITHLLCSVYMASLEDIDNIFNNLKDIYPSEKWISIVRLQCIAKHQKEMECKYHTALSNYTEAYNSWLQYENDNDLNCWKEISNILYMIGDIYHRDMVDIPMANNVYDVALEVNQKALEKSIMDYERINILDRLAMIYEAKKSCSNDENDRTENDLMIIKYKKLAIDSMIKYSSSKSLELATRMETIAEIYESISNYDDALMNYEQTLNIRLQTCDQYEFLGIINTSSKIIELYNEHKRDFNSILKYQLIKHEHVLKQIQLRKRGSNDLTDFDRTKIAYSHIDIANTYIPLHAYDDALNNYENALQHFLQRSKSNYSGVKEIAAKMVKIFVEHKHDYNSALKYRLIMHENILKENAYESTDDETDIIQKTENIVVSYIQLATTYMKLHKYDKAYENITIALKTYQEMKTDQCYKEEMIATTQYFIDMI